MLLMTKNYPIFCANFEISYIYHLTRPYAGFHDMTFGNAAWTSFCWQLLFLLFSFVFLFMDINLDSYKPLTRNFDQMGGLCKSVFIPPLHPYNSCRCRRLCFACTWFPDKRDKKLHKAVVRLLKVWRNPCRRKNVHCFENLPKIVKSNK